MRRLEDVLKDAANVFPRAFVGIDTERAVTKVERAQIVEAEDVVGVAVVVRTASSRFNFCRRACWRKSEEVSMRTLCPSCSTSTETRKRWSRGSSEVQVSHSQPMEGTPVEVPVPSRVNFIQFSVFSFRFSVSAKDASDT